MPYAKDISGMRFGKLVPLSMSYRNAKRESFWKCRCDCGKEAVVRMSNLVTGNTKSCGCSQHGS